MLQQLAVLVAIAPRRLDLGRALQPQHPLLDARCRHEPIGGADGDDQVVAGAVLDRAEVRLQRARALVHEEHLVRHAVAVVVTHRLRGTDHPERHVRVEEEGHAPGQGVAGRIQVLRVDQVMPMRRGAARIRRLDRYGCRLVDLVRLGGWRVVVEERRASGEALDAEELLRVQRSVVASELGVALVGHASALHVEHVAILGPVPPAHRPTARGSATIRRMPIGRVARTGSMLATVLLAAGCATAPPTPSPSSTPASPLATASPAVETDGGRVTSPRFGWSAVVPAGWRFRHGDGGLAAALESAARGAVHRQPSA